MIRVERTTGIKVERGPIRGMKEEITKEKGGDAALEYCAEEAPKKSKLLETLQYCFLSFLHINI